MTPPTLSTMPATVLDAILKDSDLVTIQILRKVCHNLRDHIDHAQFDYKLQKVAIEEHTTGYITLEYYFGDQRTRIYYRKHENGCLEKYQNKEKLLENQDPATLAGNDLGLVLKNEKSQIDAFWLEFQPISQRRLSEECLETPMGRFLASFEPYLKSRTSHLKVMDFEIKGTKEERQILKLLPCFEPKTLENIEIRYQKRSWQDASQSFNLDEIVELEQWKKARHIHIDGLNVTSSLINFVNFEFGELEMKQITIDDIMALREAALNREPNYRNHFRVEYRHFVDQKNFINRFGKPYPGSDEGNLTWYYRFPNSDRGLDISWCEKGKVIGCHIITATHYEDKYFVGNY